MKIYQSSFYLFIHKSLIFIWIKLVLNEVSTVFLHLNENLNWKIKTIKYYLIKL